MKSIKKVQKKIKKIQAIAKRVENVANKVNKVANAPLRSAGGAIGAKLGSRRIGSAIGGGLGKIVGTGDYTVTGNTIARQSATMALDTVPQFLKRGNRETRVTHREYLGKVVASSDGSFNISSYPINPGLFSTFPWLSQIAQNFDEWRPNGIVVVYKTMSSSYSGTSSLGIITIASDYDVSDPPYVNTVEMNNSDFAVSTNVATSLMHPIECVVSERPMRLLYTRSGPIASTDNLRFYDLCNVQVATEGCTADQVCGELWISYDISFYKAQISRTPINLNPLVSSWQSGTWANACYWGSADNFYTPNTTFRPTISGQTLNFNNDNGAFTGRSFIICSYLACKGGVSFQSLTFPTGFTVSSGMELYPISNYALTPSLMDFNTIVEPEIKRITFVLGIKITGPNAILTINPGFTITENGADTFNTIVEIPNAVPFI